jgi:hypothetical protein
MLRRLDLWNLPDEFLGLPFALTSCWLRSKRSTVSFSESTRPNHGNPGKRSAQE